MPDITVIDLSDVELHDEGSSDSDELQEREYQLGEIVSVEGFGPGIVAAFVEENFKFPVGDPDEIETKPDEEADKEEIEASPENPMYIVALQEGGSVAASPDEISSGTLEGEDGAEIESWTEVTKSGDEAELAPVYDYCDDPGDMAELQKAKKKLLFEENASALADYVETSDASLAVLEEMSYEELQNIPGVDDPETGFAELPPNWTRKSVLQAWASLGGMWRTCFPRMVRVRGPNFAKRWCAALKDEVLGTEEWRGSF